jgi:hypothetical protein
MIHAHAQASRGFLDNAEAFPGMLAAVFALRVIFLRVLVFKVKEVVGTIFLQTHAHQLLRRALQFNVNSPPQSKEKKPCALQIV